MDFHAASTLSFPTRVGERGKGRPRDDRSFPVSTVIRGTGRRTFVQPLVGLLSWRTWDGIRAFIPFYDSLFPS